MIIFLVIVLVGLSSCNPGQHVDRQSPHETEQEMNAEITKDMDAMDKEKELLNPNGPTNFESIVALDDTETRSRGLDFSQDYRLLNELGQAVFERARQERGDGNRPERDRLLGEARGSFERALALDPENTTALYNLSLIHRQLGDTVKGGQYLLEYQKYRIDDNARGQAVSKARIRDPAASHAAEALVVYDLNRRSAYERGVDASERAASAFELITSGETIEK